MSQKHFNEVKACNHGPGGWKCVCCNIGRDTKELAHRVYRRVMKIRLKKSIQKEIT